MGLARSFTLLRQAAPLLPRLPATIEVLSESDGALRLRLLAVHSETIEAHGPWLRLRPGMRLRARLEGGDGDRHDLDLIVSDLTQEDAFTARIRLKVTGLHRRKPGRVDARLPSAGRCGLYVITCRELPAGQQFPVEVVDLSASGLAFLTDRPFQLGDLVALMPTVNGVPVRLRARVLNARPAGERSRVGCEVIAVRDDDRARLARLAAAGGSCQGAPGAEL
jgi:PilZ domain